MQTFLATLNHLSGLFLALIAIGVWVGTSALQRIHSEIECLHEDFDHVHNAHEIANQKQGL